MRRPSKTLLAAVLLASFSQLLPGCDCSYEGSIEPPGDIHAFDPIGAAPAVQRFAGRGARLVEMKVQHCPPTGLVDLEAPYYEGWTVPVSYMFVRPTQAQGDPSLPIGARPAVAPTEGVQVDIMKPHWRTISTNGSETQAHHRGMHAEVESAPDDPPVALPACPLVGLWAAARTSGAPANAVATIKYDATGYTFEIPSTEVALHFDAACKLVQGDGGAHGAPGDPLGNSDVSAETSEP